MPSVTLHLVLADRVLDTWENAPSTAPFDLRDANLRNAFYQGAVGPDLGYFPGGHRFLSDLAHLVRTGDLTRALLDTARTPEEEAFSWGWVTHVLADQAIHPLVGRGVGELVYGDASVFAESARHETPHVRLETGLDALFSHRYPDLRSRAMAPVFHGASIRFLVSAYKRVYRILVDPTLYLVSHLAAARMSGHGLSSIGLLSRVLLAPSASPLLAGARKLVRRSLSALATGFGKSPLLLAYLNPLPPPDWLVEEVDAKVEGFAPRFLRHFEGRCRDLANFNLDSGLVDEPPITHLGARMALGRLQRGTLA